MATCNCCGCVLADGETSIVSGTGSAVDPYGVDIIDPMFADDRYAIRRQRTTLQTIANDALTDLDFTVATPESFDRGGFFQTPSTFIVPSSGIYIFGATVAFNDNATGTRYLEIVKNNSVVLTAMESNSSAGTFHFVTTSSSAPLYANETLKVRVKQTSTAPLDIMPSGEQSPVFWAIYVGRFG